MSSDTQGAGLGALAQRLERLFTTVHPPDRGPYSLREAAQAINQAAGRPLISYNYLYQLRKGLKTEPGHTRLAAIARFFGVPVTYFSDDDEAARIEAQLELATALRDAGVREVAARVAGLSPASIQAILGVIDNARRLEGLPSADETAVGPPAAASGSR
jgi:transcriptional regulator with XRE-family HTH domain